MSKAPSTPATRLLRAQGVAYTEHLYRYEERGGTRMSAQALGVDEHIVVKTLVLEDDQRRPLIVLMHGDREVSLKALGRAIGARSVDMCEPKTAQRHSGYQVGGTSPYRHARADAGVRRAHDPRARSHLHQRRRPRLPRRHPCRRARPAAQSDAG